MIRYVPLIILLVCGCSSDAGESVVDRQVIAARDIPGGRVPIYRVVVPEGWRRIDPSQEESIADTMKPLTEFMIEGDVKITIHNFPSSKQEERIPPIAQISRWKRQFDQLNPADQTTVLQSFSGYEGFLFEGYGLIKGIPTGMMGWILQMGSDNYRILSRPDFHPQMHADVTIKAVGPAEKIKNYREEIIAFSRSFELIEEVPEG